MKVIVSGSFRDPSGFVFSYRKEIYRQVNKAYKGTYESLLRSGLYEDLSTNGLLVAHDEIAKFKGPTTKDAYKIIKPQQIPFISYPYEWSFSMLKDAALLTLEVQKRALARDHILKDASSYNVQFLGSKPIFIDTLSFEKYNASEPWIAYRQFCQHFLAPLALMAYCDVRSNKLLIANIDGIPLDMAKSLLPKRTQLKMGLLFHIHTHAKAQAKHGASGVGAKQQRISKRALVGIIDSLEQTIRGLKWNPAGTEWGEYYTFTNYQKAAFKRKMDYLESYIKATKPKTVWDLGANTGVFSRIAAKRSDSVIAFDIDPAAVEKHYLKLKDSNDIKITPLVQDLTNPSSSIGWAGVERLSLADRGPADVVMALALVHHLRIGNNVPLISIADYLSKLGDKLIIEYVPKNDSQVRKLLASRKDIFGDYTQAEFELAFKQHYRITKRSPIKGTKRTLYLMKAKHGKSKS